MSARDFSLFFRFLFFISTSCWISLWKPYFFLSSLMVKWTQAQIRTTPNWTEVGRNGHEKQQTKREKEPEIKIKSVLAKRIQPWFSFRNQSNGSTIPNVFDEFVPNGVVVAAAPLKFTVHFICLACVHWKCLQWTKSLTQMLQIEAETQHFVNTIDT